jgi:hypothetical protein
MKRTISVIAALLVVLLLVATTTHAAAGAEHSGSECLACGLCEWLASVLHH